MAGRVVVVGATGQIGRPLCRELALAGHPVSVFSRDPARARQLVPGAADYLAWSPGSRLTAQCAGHLAAADAVVYLAGGALFDGGRHSRSDIEAESRARASALGHLVAALGGLDRRPGALIAASSVGYYGFAGHGDEPTDESSPCGHDWWGADSAAIEQAALSARQHGVRTVVLRTGYVLTPASLASQVAQFRRHLGGWIGTGRGWTPWIHIADEVGLIAFALQRPDIDGQVNLTAPEPVTARQFARALGRVLGRRAWLPVPAPFVRIGLGAVTDILTRGKRVLPAKARVRCYQRVGSRPQAELLDCLAAHGMSLARELATAPPSKVAAAVLGAAPPAGLIVVADQFEPLYTECTDAERNRFVELLLHLATDTVKVVIGLRADFYHLALADLGEQLAAGQVALAPMSEQDLTQAITEPAGRLLRSFQPGLAQRIAADVRGRPDDLPLLQFALTRLWDCDEADGVLTEETYLELGAVLEDGTHLPGAQGALIHGAEELWRDLSLSDRIRLRRILLGLIAAQPAVTSSDHLADSLRDLSRPALRAQWDDDDQQLIQQLIDARLLTADGAAAHGRATIEVSHEALLRAWPRLRNWLEGRGTYVQWRAQDLAPNLERWLNSKFPGKFSRVAEPLPCGCM